MVDQVETASSGPTDAPCPQAGGPSAFGMAWRVGLTGCIVVALAYGTLVGNDGDWPFGPMRQYASSTPVSSQVLLTHVSGRTRTGRTIRLDTEALGLRVAELDGQLPRLRQHPELLLSLATAYHRAYPHRPPLVRLILMRDGKLIRNRKVVGRIHRVVAEVEVR